MLMNAFDKPVQSNTEQAGRGHGFARMFDRVCAFLDERVGGASALIAACQSVADRFWHSKLYFPVCFLMLAVFMAAGLPVVGGVLVMSTLIFLLLFCDDLLSVLFPVVLLAMVGTEFYEELYSRLRFWWIGLLAAAALLVHIGAYARAPRNGGCLHGMVAVSVATLLGGLGFISREEYFAPTALYYSLGLGVVMLLVYLLCRSEADRTRDYDVAERMLQILYAGGLFTGFVVALFYARHMQEFVQDFSTIYFKYRNFSATMLLISLPAVSYFAARDRRHFLAVAFLYFMMLMTGSRSGLIFGTAMLLLCLAYVYYCNPERRAVYRRVGLISLIPAVAEASGAEVITVALRRVDLGGPQDNVINHIPGTMRLLPNTSGARTADEAVRIARLSRAAGCGDWIKIEVISDTRHLLPDGYETAKATEILAKEGFTVLPYMNPDL